PIVLDVSAVLDQYRILKQIVRRAVLLEDDHHMLDLGGGGGGGMDTLLPPPQPLRLSRNPPTQNIRDRITNNAARLMVGCPRSRSRLVDGLRHEPRRRAFPLARSESF